MLRTAHLNFQSNLNVLKFKFKNSLKISNFKFQIIFLFAIFYLLFTIPVFAQTAPPPNTNSNVPNNMHTYTQNVMIEVMSAMTCQLTGIDPVNPSQQCLGIDSVSKKIGFVNLPSSANQSGQAGGAIGFVGNLIAATYTPPLHTGDYFNYLAQNFGIAKPVYAQGIGFTGLNPILNIWSAFRNIVYLLFVVVFVVIGLAIMLRLHIDPRTVMTIENQIPKIIIGLVMVTFSFAIAGFLIDMMYVSIYAVNGVIKDIPNGGANAAAQFAPGNMQGVSPLEATGGFGGINGMVSPAADSIRNTIASMLGLKTCSTTLFDCAISIFKSMPKIPSSGILPDIGNAFISAIEAVLASALGYIIHTTSRYIPWLIAYLVIFVAVLWALFRLWFQLIIAYIYILIDVVLAPFWILAGLFPGSSIGFGAWLRDIVANLSAFPVTITMFMLGNLFMNIFKNTDGFVPPLLGAFGGTEPIGALIGIGIILMTPQVVTMMRDLLKAPGFKYAAAIGQAVGVGAGVSGGTVTQTGGTIFTAFKGAMPQPGETGLAAIARRIFR